MPGVSSQGAGIDPLNPSDASGVYWDDSNAFMDAKSYGTEALHYRDDYMLMTSSMYATLVPGSYQVFGNNGTTSFLGAVNSGSNTSLNDVVADGGTFISASDLLNDLLSASDHYPIVADFVIPVPEPSALVLTVLALLCTMVLRGEQPTERAKATTFSTVTLTGVRTEKYHAVHESVNPANPWSA